jgi:hypothetical protein
MENKIILNYVETYVCCDGSCSLIGSFIIRGQYATIKNKNASKI